MNVAGIMVSQALKGKTDIILKCISGLACPAKDTSCAAADKSNVITKTITNDDAECGGNPSNP